MVTSFCGGEVVSWEVGMWEEGLRCLPWSLQGYELRLCVIWGVGCAGDSTYTQYPSSVRCASSQLESQMGMPAQTGPLVLWWFCAAQIGFQGEGARHPNSFTGGKLFGQFVFSLVRSIDLGSRPCPQRNQLWKSKLGLTCAVIGCCQLIKNFGWAAASCQKSNPFR